MMGRYKKKSVIGPKKKGATKKRKQERKADKLIDISGPQCETATENATSKRKRSINRGLVTSTPESTHYPTKNESSPKLKRTRIQLVLDDHSPPRDLGYDDSACSPFSPGSAQLEDVSSINSEDSVFLFESSMAISIEHSYASLPSLKSAEPKSPTEVHTSPDVASSQSMSHTSTSWEPVIIDPAHFPVMYGPHYPQDYITLRDELRAQCPPGDFDVQQKSERIRFHQLYHLLNDITIIKLSVTITPSFQASIRVHNQELAPDHHVWEGLGQTFNSKSKIYALLQKIEQFSICCGNNEKEYVDLVPPSKGLSNSTSTTIQGYHESNFSESTIRGTTCSLLVKGKRCACCTKLRHTLRMRKSRKETTNEENRKYIPNCHLSNEQLLEKTKTLAKEKRTLTSRLDQYRRKIERMIATESPALDPVSSVEVSSLCSSLDSEVKKAWGPESFQRIFWEEQMKYNKLRDARGMRWHPLILKWCIYMHSRSPKAYESMRKGGFVNLPSKRTLFDYTHFCKSQTGYSSDVLEQLSSECDAKGMYQDEWRQYVGLLQDEIRIKEDIVYDKHSGELIGYVDLDDISNQLVDLENVLGQQGRKVARYMLVLMVRGISSDLKYPLAAFATDGITSDFLYPIIWEGIGYLEGICGLKVLFITCDGASPNRKFFELHRGNRQGTIFWTMNPFSTDNRKLYFISDPPHLIKTARNCMANSYSHKKTRELWKGGKSISWMHLVQLYHDHVENKVLSPCPKLTRAHVDLTAFGQMKVNLAAQIFSQTVALALRRFYGDHVSETATFLEKMNTFFDIMNTNRMGDGYRRRNPNLHPFREANDPRLEWLMNDFLEYLNEWKRDVMQSFPDVPKQAQAAKQLSHQTLNGLVMTVHSVVECVKFLLDKGVPFVRTVVFNQDVLEQQFGHYRRKGGCNDNPTVFEVVHAVNTLRVSHGHAIAPIRGNITGNVADQVVDVNVPLPRRQRRN